MTSAPGTPRPLPDFLRRGDPALGRPGPSPRARVRAALGLPAHPGMVPRGTTPEADAHARHWASLVDRGLIGGHLKRKDEDRE